MQEFPKKDFLKKYSGKPKKTVTNQRNNNETPINSPRKTPPGKTGVTYSLPPFLRLGPPKIPSKVSNVLPKPLIENLRLHPIEAQPHLP
jgi:hypothetical protein